MSEPFDEQLVRVRGMAGGSSKWDLSENDCKALTALLAERDALRQALTFYANQANYEPTPAPAWAEPAVPVDRGDMARAALEGEMT